MRSGVYPIAHRLSQPSRRRHGVEIRIGPLQDGLQDQAARSRRTRNGRGWLKNGNELVSDEFVKRAGENNTEFSSRVWEYPWVLQDCHAHHSAL